MIKQHTRCDRGGENGLSKNTLGGTERLAMKGLTGLEVKGGWCSESMIDMGSEPSRELWCTNYITSKHVELFFYRFKSENTRSLR